VSTPPLKTPGIIRRVVVVPVVVMVGATASVVGEGDIGGQQVAGRKGSPQNCLTPGANFSAW